MATTIRGQVGPAVLQDGTEQSWRLAKSGEGVVQELHGRYYEQSYRQGIFVAVNAASTSSAALSTTYTGGVCISNPAGNTKNLVILKVSGALVVISAAVPTFWLAGGLGGGGVTGHTTAL